jgi:hypothetical protein
MGDYEKSLQTSKKGKVKKNNEENMALAHKKKGDDELAAEKLKEAQAITGMDNDPPRGSQPSNKEEKLTQLKGILESKGSIYGTDRERGTFAPSS